MADLENAGKLNKINKIFWSLLLLFIILFNVSAILIYTGYLGFNLGSTTTLLLKIMLGLCIFLFIGAVSLFIVFKIMVKKPGGVEKMGFSADPESLCLFLIIKIIFPVPLIGFMITVLANSYLYTPLFSIPSTILLFMNMPWRK